MVKSPYRNLFYFRIDGECFVPSAFVQDYRCLFDTGDDQDISGAITERIGQQNFGHILHTCFFKTKDKKSEKFHFLYQIDKLKQKDSAKQEDSNLFDKIDLLLRKDGFRFSCSLRAIFKYSRNKYMNIFGLPKREVLEKLKMKQKGSIFEIENDPSSSFLCEITKTNFVVAKQFKLVKFRYSREAIDKIIAQNAEQLYSFIKEVK